ncbi:type III secretion system outer membrane ring subunit SctC [Cupriavidus pauculus]|uniref:type III secretion system outer membrane ring subunit SctC n=1 Tax=Cupriavidus pauculus TaxID=82633 RepID=UPI0021E05FDD|nr:type III secretion system outer membrane ring subunit SctC [Cupriavidus pauculus]
MANRTRSNASRARRPLRTAAVGAIIGLQAMTATFAPAALAAPIPWRSSNISYVADRKDIQDVLRDISASAGVAVQISPKVKGTVSGRFDTRPQLMLERMAATFGFIWYYDGAVLRIYSADEVVSTTIGLSAASTSSLRRSLSKLQIEDPRFPIRFDDDARTAVVSGPPRYVELVNDVAKLVDQNHVDQQHGQAVRVFPLRYAWAADHKVTVDGQSITIRGVANMLRDLYQPDGGQIGSQTAPQSDARRLRNVAETDSGSPGGGSRSRLPEAQNGWIIGLPGLMGGGGPAGANAPLPGGVVPDGGGAPAPRRGGRLTDVYPEDRPIIQADPRTNSILVRGRPDRMASFQSLIESLDVRPAVLEIDANIIEITDNALQQLGVDWRAHSGHIDFAIGNGQNAQAGYPGSLNPNGYGNPNDRDREGNSLLPTTPVGGVFTAVLGGAGKYLLSRISALAQTDQATLNASPKVATLDNVEAVMDNKQTFYVPVSGYQSADLYGISAGVSLRVLPMIVPGSDNAGTPSQIRLNVHIEDGQLTSQTVSNLPVVSNSTIDTQALISEGESLLIAGYTAVQDQRQETGVPGLSKIPWIGGLFRYRNHSGQKFQRLFLVTPRILRAPSPADLDGDTTGGPVGIVGALPAVPTVAREVRAVAGVRNVAAQRAPLPMLPARPPQLAELGHGYQPSQPGQPAQSAPPAQPAQPAQSAQLAQLAQLARSAQLAQSAQSAQSGQLARSARLSESARLAQTARLAQSARLAESARLSQSSSVGQPASSGQSAPLAPPPTAPAPPVAAVPPTPPVASPPSLVAAGGA